LISQTEITLRYGAGAALATLVNLGTQSLSFHLYRGPGELMLGIMCGTVTGLIGKYLFDKFWIFFDPSLELAENIQKFAIYCATGAFTTAIFWGTEATAALLSDGKAMRYVGALIGLSIGYFLKFHLDRRFVFRARP
jgi:putative flippase GtrA